MPLEVDLKRDEKKERNFRLIIGGKILFSKPRLINLGNLTSQPSTDAGVLRKELEAKKKEVMNPTPSAAISGSHEALGRKHSSHSLTS